MTRLRYDGLATGASGSLVAASLSGAHNNSTTTLTLSAALTHDGGTAVPTITGSDYFMLSILDGDGLVAEIVRVTAYTSGATTATMTRGQEGTPGVAHAGGARVVNAPTVEDFTLPALTYTPALTAVTTNPTLGAGSGAFGRYEEIGKRCVGDLSVKFGTSGAAAGSGSYRVSLPLAARTPTDFEGFYMGQGYVFDDSSSAVRGVFLTRVTSTTVQLTVTDGSNAVNNTVPWTWANNDLLLLHFDYELP